MLFTSASKYTYISAASYGYIKKLIAIDKPCDMFLFVLIRHPLSRFGDPRGRVVNASCFETTHSPLSAVLF